MRNVLIGIAAVLFSVGFALAGETINLPDGGLTPESPFYFLDTWGEKINLAFTFRAENQVQKMNKYAEEKLAEAKEMIENNNTLKLGTALQKYQDYLEKTVDTADEAKKQGKNMETVLANVAEATQKHLIVLADVYEKAPEQAKDAILNAMEKSANGQENALQAISGEGKQEVEKNIEVIKEKYQLEKTPNDLPQNVKKSIEQKSNQIENEIKNTTEKSNGTIDQTDNGNSKKVETSEPEIQE